MWAPIIRTIRSGRRFVITTHENADHDALGAELALAWALKKLKKDVTLLNVTSVPRACRFMLRSDPDAVKTYRPAAHDPVIARADAVFLLDLNDWDRLGRMARAVRESRALKLCIDHHRDGRRFADLRRIDPGASSTGELVERLLRALRLPLTPLVAEWLYCCIVMDTGRFLHSTGPRTLSTAARLLECGVDRDRLHRDLFFTRGERYYPLLCSTLHTLRVLPKRKTAYAYLDELSAAGLSSDGRDTEGFCDYLRALEGVELALFFRPAAGGQVKVTLRSKTGESAWKVASALGGGGHARASGAKVPGPVSRAIRTVLKTVDRIRPETLSLLDA